MEGFWKRMTCCFPECIGHCRPSLPVLIFTVILFSSVHPAAGSVLSPLPDLNNLNNRDNKLLNDPGYQKGQHGARAVDLAARHSLLAINGDAPLIPALTTKIVTSATALLRSSPHYRVRTMLQTNAPIQHGVPEGDLYLKGYGDPALVIAEAWLLVRGLRQQGVHRIQGDLIGDDSFFDSESRGRG
jgi:D-alanyl-D-alanine carboxypeptidase